MCSAWSKQVAALPMETTTDRSTIYSNLKPMHLHIMIGIYVRIHKCPVASAGQSAVAVHEPAVLYDRYRSVK